LTNTRSFPRRRPIKELRNELTNAEKREQETRRELEEEVRRLQERLESVKSESAELEGRYRRQRDKMQGITDAQLNALVGVFKLGFVSGLLLSALLVLGFRF